MGMSMDNKQRTEERKARAVKPQNSIKLYTLTELEDILDVSHRTLQTYMKTGRIKGQKIGGKWKVTEDSLMKFLNGEE